jgi:hypothetical protein
MSIEMTLSNEIESILATLGSLITPGLPSALVSSSLFEGYLLSLVLQAAKLEGASIDYRDVDGSTPTKLVFRTSPGYIASKAKPYTYAIITFPNKPVLEAHIGVRVAGSTGVLHQCDVAVIKQTAAERCRRASQSTKPGQPIPWVSPKHSELILAVECKFYAKADLGLDLARSFIGLVSDIYKPSFYFVTSTSSDSVETLLRKKKKDCRDNIIPSSTQEVTKLLSAFQDTFTYFKTLHR